MKITVYSGKRGIKTLKEGVTLEQYQERYPDAIKVKVPSAKRLERMMCEERYEAIDVCEVEADGICEHGFPSWLMAMGLI